MSPRNFAYQIRTLVDLEQRNRMDYTERLQTVYHLRINTIDAMDVPEAEKNRLIAQAHMQYTNFAKRTPPEV